MDLEKAKKALEVEEGRLAEREKRLAEAKADLAAKQDALREILVAGADGRPNDRALAKARDDVGAASVRVQELEIVVGATGKRIPELAEALQAARLGAAQARFNAMMAEKLSAATEADAAIDGAMDAIRRYLKVSREAYSAAVDLGRGHDGLLGTEDVEWTLQWRVAQLYPPGSSPFGLPYDGRSLPLVDLLKCWLPALPAGAAGRELPPAA